jgi:hypothetical protein
MLGFIRGQKTLGRTALTMVLLEREFIKDEDQRRFRNWVVRRHDKPVLAKRS